MSTKGTTLSVIIITKNEEHNIRRCLESVKWADEIVVLDSGSTDNTLAIVREYTDQVKVTDWPGFGPQKNRALECATKDWVLSIDADEWLSDELQQEIKQAINHDTSAAYSLPRKSFFCGRLIRFGDWKNDRITRLFKRGAAKFNNMLVHEAVEIDEKKVAPLKHPIYHHTYDSIDSAVSKMNYYSMLAAQTLHQAQKKASLSKAIVRGLWTFFRSYFLKMGILDGKFGFVIAVTNAQASYYKYLKLMLLTSKNN